MAFSTVTAKGLVGKPRSAYLCNQVVNETLTGNKNSGMLAKDYLNWGSAIGTPAAGVVVVGLDGAHVGIFISPTEFIHSSVTKQQVITAPLSQLPYVFSNGYAFRFKN